MPRPTHPSTHPPAGAWEFWIDRGGTFTDIVARRADGTLVTRKLLSDNPRQYADAAIAGIRDILQVPPDQPLATDSLAAVKMGTTVATNALLERRGAAVLLAITRGLRDQLRIGYQTRPDLFALNIELPAPLYAAVVEINERVAADGEVITPLDTAAAERDLRAQFAAGITNIAIVLMHGYRYHAHELALAELAAAIGFRQISVSHQVSPLMKIVARGDTTVVDAYLSPVLHRYVDHLASQLAGLARQRGRLMFMRSNGGLADAQFFHGKDAVLSGPAGGVVGMARVSAAAGFDRVIGFDMGGTSTDVSHYNGQFEKTFAGQVAGVRIRAPMLLLHTVAAGGGSRVHFDGARFRVGPDSAGANPGPACYRQGGPLAITDCNVMLGTLSPDFFPKVFGPAADQPLDRAVVIEQFQQLAERVQTATGEPRRPEAIAAGFLTIAVANMANAIKKISVQRGYDVSTYTLCCFGGAGGQHASAVADALGMTRVLLHPLAGVLSAYGMGLADTTVERARSIEARLDAVLVTRLKTDFADLQAEAIAELCEQGQDGASYTSRHLLYLRYDGTDTAIAVGADNVAAMTAQFTELHQQQFGFTTPERELVVESIHVEVTAAALMPPPPVMQSATHAPAKPLAVQPCYFSEQWLDTPFYARDELAVGQVVTGPAVIIEPTATTVVEPGWQACRSADHNLLLERYGPKTTARAIGTAVEPVMLEIFNNLFMAIAEQMGVVLENTAASVNIKERLDFSCAIFAPDGALVANAPHMPVHLGSMGESIKTIIRTHGETMRAGDAYIMNAPYAGGTHLPDVTIIKPVFSPAATADEATPADSPHTILFYVAARGHHADIGGQTPGSAPADSTHIAQEGIVIEPTQLVAQGQFQAAMIHQLLTSGRWPARNPAMNIADFKAQLAACEKGARELLHMTAQYGVATVHAYMQHVQDNAEAAVRRVLATLPDGEFRYAMDDGSEVAVAIRVQRAARRATIDFSGTSKQHPGNFNAPTAVVTAAVLYVFRCLVADAIPLNEGCLRPLTIIIPEDSMINPKSPAAVIAGNVETSQYLVDTLFGALGGVAAAQGTMNNFIWGNDEYQYYETICGGAGATAQRDGATAVHTHMTNSRLTDPEVLEWRFPVRLREFAIRANSGGRGQQRGGDGVIRAIEFLQPMLANIIAGHRKVPPYGVAGGKPGQVGHNYVRHPDGRTTQLPSTARIELAAGDIVVIETPGGGGYGA